MKNPAVMLGGRLAGGRVDGHAADRIADDGFRPRSALGAAAAGAVRMMIMVGMGHPGCLCVSGLVRR